MGLEALSAGAKPTVSAGLLQCSHNFAIKAVEEQHFLPQKKQTLNIAVRHAVDGPSEEIKLQ